ncbi:MAG: ribose 5-phosphate isomerase A [Spirochaetales bacterium]|nr:ribose 5-phosphate isomerase A [Spirochaetales bacterium]
MTNKINVKQKVGYEVIDRVARSGQRFGMGTGSTAFYAMERLAQKLNSGELTDIKIVPTSFQTSTVLQNLGIQVYSMNDPVIGGELDVAVDGADEVDEDFCLVKGGGGAHFLEKLVEYNTRDFYVIVDESKIVAVLGDRFPIPVEVVPEARVSVYKALERFGGEPELRMAVKKAGPVITDNGNLLIDVRFSGGVRRVLGLSVAESEAKIKNLVGVVEVGLFSRSVQGVFVGRSSGNVELLTKK